MIAQTVAIIMYSLKIIDAFVLAISIFKPTVSLYEKVKINSHWSRSQPRIKMDDRGSQKDKN